MRNLPKYFFKWITMLCFIAVIHSSANAQTDADAIMMTKNNFCVGAMYTGSHWTDYWEGTLKRTNDNLGIVSTQMVGLMGNYGISKKLNLIFSAPYVETKASAGTLHGQKGIQDLSLWAKWMPVETKVGKGLFSLYGIGGVSTPLTNYIADFLPLSIGVKSKTLSLRAMADYQLGSLFATVSGTYVFRKNITIDRTSYYTTTLHLTNEVEMPDANQYNIRAGYRSDWLIAEAIFTRWNTLGGFDITRNNMPFPSNRMNMSTVGLGFKYTFKKVEGLSLVGNGTLTVDGRNVGEATSLSGGVFYILDFTGKHKASKKTSNKK